MPSLRDDRDLARAARMYFLDGHPQEHIARELGTTRSNVSRMITAARDRGIVQISVHEHGGRDEELEQQVRDKYGLPTVLVARDAEPDRAAHQVGRLGANWLIEQLRDGQRIALSWGNALDHVVQAVTATHSTDVEIAQLAGALAPSSTIPNSQQLAQELARRLGGHARYYDAPAILDRPAAVDVLAEQEPIARALAVARASDLALVGVGTLGHPSSDDLLGQMHLTRPEQSELAAARPVGEICGRFYDANGRAFTGAADRRVLAVTLADLQLIPTVMAIASGASKAQAISGAIQGRIIDALCCDASAARDLLALVERR